MKKLREEFLKKLTGGSKPSYERAHALLLDDCPQAAITKCLKSPLWLERCAVALNPNTPEKAIKALLEDENAIVRAAASARAN